MNREDVIRMAREAGFEVNFDIGAASVEGVHINKELERFAALVAEKEREACVKGCEEVHNFIHENYICSGAEEHAWQLAGAKSCVDAIRKRGEV